MTLRKAGLRKGSRSPSGQMRPCLRLYGLPAPLVLLLSTSILSLAQTTNSSDGLIIETTKPVACSRPIRDGDTISVHYRGTLLSDGTEFDASLARGEPFSFKLGAHQVIQG